MNKVKYMDSFNKLHKVQHRMFEVEDLPLFSGTAPTGYIETFSPKPEHKQVALATCPLCLDTGMVGKLYCWCKAGDAVFHAGTDELRERLRKELGQ